MSSRPIVAIETNEIPPRLWSWYSDQWPASNIATLMREGSVGTTEVRESVRREIYPSQTWASLGTGVPFDSHGVYWYGDPKPPAFPFYWQLAAANEQTVGLVGVLHSSPLREQCRDERIVFAIPDSFAENPATRPSSLEGLQAFNLKMTRANARTVDTSRPSLAYVGSGVSAVRNGLRPTTAVRLANTVAQVGLDRTPKERLRTAQFELMSDLHFRLTKDHTPDLSVLFTNHVAAAMHRYWYATFPGDWDETLYDDAWVDRHRNEIPQAMHSLDRSLGRMAAWCDETDRTLMIMSSMGQTGGAETPVDIDRAFVVVDENQFLRGLGVHGAVSARSNMVPHLTVTFGSEADATAAVEQLRVRNLGASDLTVDQSAEVVTVTYHLDSSNDWVEIDSRQVPLGELGIEPKEVTDHRCGTHDPIGSLVVWNSPTADLNPAGADYLEVAPAILNALGVAAADHHMTPTFTL